MGHDKVNGNIKPGFQKVTFYDKEHKKKEIFNIPIGSNISTTNDNYIVKKDGVYIKNKNGKLEKQTQINVPLFDIETMKAYDADGDGYIEKEDGKALKKGNFAEKIDKRLEKAKSDYYVDYTDAFQMASADEKGFGAEFFPNHKTRLDVTNDERKTFGIKFGK